MTIGQTRRDRLRFVFLAADPFPPVRPDVMTLFGRELIRLDHQITWILTSKIQLSRGWNYYGPVVRYTLVGGEVVPVL